MRIYIVRHGYAGPSDEDDPNDFKRALRPEGRDVVQALAEYLDKNNMVPNAIYAARCVRTKETAQILGDVFGIDPVEEPGLDEGAALDQVVKKLAKNTLVTRPLLVSHREAIEKGLARLNMGVDDVDAPAMGELRVLRVDRKDGTWSEKRGRRVIPSMLGDDFTDFYAS